MLRRVTLVVILISALVSRAESQTFFRNINLQAIGNTSLDTDLYDTTNHALKIICVAGTCSGTGGSAFTGIQVRNASNAWSDVGYFTGNQSVPVLIQNGFLAVTGTFWQDTQPVSVAQTLSSNFAQYNGLAVSAGNAIHVQPGTAATWDVSDRSGRLMGHVTVDNSSIAVTGTFWQSVQPVSAASLPLPSNASQETGGNLALIASNQVSGAEMEQVVDRSGNRMSVNQNGSISVQAVASTIPPVLTSAQQSNPLLYRAAMKQYCRVNLCQ